MEIKKVHEGEDIVFGYANSMLSQIERMAKIMVSLRMDRLPNGMTPDQTIDAITLTVIDLMVLRYIMVNRDNLHEQLCFLESFATNIKNELTLNDRMREHDGG